MVGPSASESERLLPCNANPPAKRGTHQIYAQHMVYDFIPTRILLSTMSEPDYPGPRGMKKKKINNNNKQVNQHDMTKLLKSSLRKDKLRNLGEGGLTLSRS